MSLDCFMSLQSIKKKEMFPTSNNRLKILQALKENLEEISIVTALSTHSRAGLGRSQIPYLMQLE